MMNLELIIIAFAVALLQPLTMAAPACHDASVPAPGPQQRQVEPVAPKIMIVSMWTPEAQIWRDKFPDSGLGNLTAMSVSSPGLSMLYPRVVCTENGDVCQVTIGEGEINAAASVMALVLSTKFDLRRTYFLIAGIAGVNPRHGTLGGIALSRYAVQVALQYEIDPRDLPSDWTTGYIPYGRDRPLEYPSISYGSEVFEVNAKLRDLAHGFASRADLADADSPRAYRARYGALDESYGKAAEPPSVVKCDCATSDVYYSGSRLSEAFEETVRVWTNGSGVYCMTAQEDNATLEVLLRAAVESLVDFGRIMIMRSASNFDRPPPDASDLQHLTRVDQNGFSIAIENLSRSGIEIVRGILHGWDCKFKVGVAPENYIGDIFGSLGGQPDFGFGSITNGERAKSSKDVAQ